MKYRVQVAVTEYYSGWVEAENEEDAIEAADKMYSDGEMEYCSYSSDFSIIDTDDM